MKTHTTTLDGALVGAKVHPDYPDYLITPSGLVYDHTKDYWPTLVVTPKGYLEVWLRQANGQRKKVKVHRVVAQTFLELVDGKTEVDHLDRDVQNNNVNNLAWSNRSDQMRNRRGSANSTSKYVGVYFDSTRSKWLTRAKVNGKIHTFGQYDDEESAARARDAGVAKLGFAYQNLSA